MSSGRRASIIIAVVLTAAFLLGWKYRKPIVYSAFIVCTD